VLNRRDQSWDAAEGGIAFFEEVADLNDDRQAALMRYLDERSGRRAKDVRIIAGTRFDLLERIAAGRFAEALFYRLNVIHIVLAT